MKLTYEDKLKIVDLYKQGYGYTAISRKTNISYSVIIRIILKYNVDDAYCLKHTKNKSLKLDIKLEKNL